MTRAIDPFEEYLRKKKVEMLENKYRGPKGRPGAAAVGGEEEPDDSGTEERLQEEVQDFFESGQSAAARLFDRVGDGLPEEQVDEIRDALDEVFVETEAEPQAERDGTFVNFFRQVQTSFDEEHAEREQAASDREDGTEVVAPMEPPTDTGDAPPRVSPPRRPEFLENGVELVTKDAARSPRQEEPIVLPDPEEGDPAEAETADLGSEQAAAALVELFSAGDSGDSGDEESGLASEAALEVEPEVRDEPSDAEVHQEAAEAVGVLSGFEEARVDPADETGEVRIDLLDLLAEKSGDTQELRQRVDLLCRLVVRLVESSDVSQHELVEMLIKSGVEF